MSIKVGDCYVSAKINDERVTVSLKFGRGVFPINIELWASDFPYDEHAIEQKNWMAIKCNTHDESLNPADLSEISSIQWRRIEAMTKEVMRVLQIEK